MIPRDLPISQAAYVLPAGAIAIADARSHLATTDAVCVLLVMCAAPASIIHPIREAAITISGDLKTAHSPTPAHLEALNAALLAAGAWLYEACQGVTFDAEEIARTRAILRDAARAARTPALREQIHAAIATASVLLDRQSASEVELLSWRTSVSSALSAMRSSIIVMEA